jgi:hypothetical protein
MLYITTTAPADYDYPGTVEDTGGADSFGRRVIAVLNKRRFRDEQLPRYMSGLHIVYRVNDDEIMNPTALEWLLMADGRQWTEQLEREILRQDKEATE